MLGGGTDQPERCWAFFFGLGLGFGFGFGLGFGFGGPGGFGRHPESLFAHDAEQLHAVVAQTLPAVTYGRYSVSIRPSKKVVPTAGDEGLVYMDSPFATSCKTKLRCYQINRRKAIAVGDIAVGDSFQTIRIDHPNAAGLFPTLDNDIVVTDASVSRHHATIEAVNGSFRLRDLGSQNGTFIGGLRVTDAPLGDGDSVRIGDAVFTFHA